MSAYNLQKSEDREALRQERQSELDACLAGTWPRDINDTMRWNPPFGIEPVKWAAKMCQLELAYLKD